MVDQVIKLKRNTSNTNAPDTSDIVVGELAIGAVAGKLYMRKSDNSILTFSDDSNVSTTLTIGADSGSNDTVTVGTDTLTFNGTSNQIGTTVSDNAITVALADDPVIGGTGSIRVPDGTTAQRPGSPAAGMFRYNTTTGKFEGYTDEWGDIGGGGSNTFTRNAFTGDGSTTGFTLSQTVSSENDLIVFIEGVFQDQDAYSVSGTTLTFDTAPASGRGIIVYSVKHTVAGSNLNIDTMTGDGSDTTLSLTISPNDENNTQVFIDGVYQNKSTYSISGSTLTFSTAPPNGSAVECMTFTQTDVNEATYVTANANNSTNETVYPTFVDGATGKQEIETDTGLTYNPSTGLLTTTLLAGTLNTAAQTNITSLGTLTTLTVDDITINGSTISDADHLTIDSGNYIYLDADGGNVVFQDNGTSIGTLSNQSSNFTLVSNVQDKDIVFKGNDGGSTITAMTIDMSEGGNVGIGSTGPDKMLVVQGTDAEIVISDTNSTPLLRFREDGTTASTIHTGSGSLYFATKPSGGSITNHGAFDTDGHFYILSGNLKMGTTNVLNSGRVLYNLEQIKLADSKDLIFGASDDLKIYHNGSHSFISEEGAGALKVKGDDIRFENASGTEAVRITDGGTLWTNYGNPSSSSTIIIDKDGSGEAGLRFYNAAANTAKVALNSDENLVVEATNDIILDAGGQNWYFEDDGTRVFSISQVSSDVYLGSEVSDKDLIFRVNDGGSTITALTLDASEAGRAIFTGSVALDSDSAQLQLGDDNDMQIYHNGSAGEINNATGDFTIDAAGNITLDADGGAIGLNDGGTHYASFENSSNSLYIETKVSDKDIILRGNDGGSTITALTLDMSEAGKATFNAGIDVGGVVKFTGGYVLDSAHSIRLDSASSQAITFSQADSEKMRIHTDGKVGIGTASPGDLLELSGASPVIRGTDTDGGGAKINFGSGNITLDADYGAAESSSIINFKVDGSEAARFDSSGKLGIGTTSPNALLNMVSASSPTFRIKDTTNDCEAMLYAQDANAHFGTSSNHPLIIDTNNTERMRITADGNVGIGTASPSAPLDVVVDSTVWTGEFTQSNTSNGDGVLVSVGSTAAADYALSIRSDAGNTHVLAAKADGNVGIGTATPNQWASYTDSAATVLNVTDSSQRARLVAQGGNGAHLDLVDSGGGSDDKHLNLSVDGGIGKFGSLNDAGNAWVKENILVMDIGSGNVGIGTTSPDGPLHIMSASAGTVDAHASADELVVEGSGNAGINILSGNSSEGGIFFGDDGDNDIGRIRYDHSNNSLDFFANAAERMTIDSSGKVGIGITSPLSHLTFESDHWNTGTEDGPSIRWNNGITTADSVLQNFEDSNVAPFVLGMNSFVSSGGSFTTFNNSYAASYLYLGASGAITMGTSSSGTATERMQIKNSGEVLIGTQTAVSNAKLTVDGGDMMVHGANNSCGISDLLPGYTRGDYGVVHSTANHVYFSVGSSYVSYINGGDGTFNVSDQRLKENVATLTGALDKVKQLRGVSFTWKDTEERGTDTKIGLIAQEVEAVYPQLVDDGGLPKDNEGNDPYKSVNYAHLTSVLIEAIKELSAELDSAKARIKTLEDA